MKLNYLAAIAAASVLGVTTLTSCSNSAEVPTTDEATEAIEGAAEKTGEAVEDAAAKTGDAIDGAVDSVKDAANPCAAEDPCAAADPCAADPCAAE